MAENPDPELHNKIDLLRQTVISNVMDLSEKMNKFAYEHGMTEELAEKILKKQINASG